MTFFLKLRHWQLFLMLALPTLLYLMFRIPFSPLVVSAIGLFLMLVLFARMFSVGSCSNRKLAPCEQSNATLFAAALALLQREQADIMIFSNAFFLPFVLPINVWLIQPRVNQLSYKLQQGSSEA